jgi:hypothetical protein
MFLSDRQLAAFGAPLEGLKAEDFIEPDKFFRIGNAPVMVKIFPQLKGIDFDQAWERRVETTIDPDTGLTVSLISRDDLIASKLAAARPQDLADVDALRKAAQSQRNQPTKKDRSK